MILSYLLLLGCGKETTPEVKIRAIADFVSNYDKITKAPVSITFTNKSKNAYEYIWDFGDGGKSTTDKKTVYHTYGTSGSYTVILSAIGMPGDTSYKIGIVNIK